MIVKTIFMLLLYSLPILFLCLGVVSSPFLVVFLYLLSGLGIAGIGMGVMHDANHGAYTKKAVWGKVLGKTMDFMGCSSFMWKIQHNVLHHTFTNIHGHDEDIDAPSFLLRFSPHSKSYKIHKYQHYYIWFFYSLMTIYWVFWKDFKKANEYYQMGLIKTKKERLISLLKLIPLKLAYITYALVLPLVFTPTSAWWVVIGFVLMHLLAGVLLSVVFQLAHVVPHMSFPQSNEQGEMDNSWHIHQLITTSNFSPKSKFLFWYFGGLTNQIEHHLFPNICHVHYQKISRIVAQTAHDFKVPYHVNKTFFSAISNHVKMLRVLGKMKPIQQ